MTIGPLQLIRQATPGQRRTLLAASMGWALDAFDAMLYSLVLALLLSAVERARIRECCTRGVRQKLENAKLSAPYCTTLGNEEDVQRT